MDIDIQNLEQELENAVIESLSTPFSERTQVLSPNPIYILPVVRRPFFPGMAAPIIIEPGPFLDILKIISKTEEKCLGLILTKSEEVDIYKANLDDLHSVGVLAKVLRVIPMEQGGAQIILNMERRFVVEAVVADPDFLLATVSYVEDVVVHTEELKAYSISIISTIKELLKLNPLFKEELQVFLGHSDFTAPGKLADFAVALTTATRDELQSVLATFDVPERIEKALILLKKELDISILQSNINKKIDATINKSQKDFFLREQLKTIKKELGLERDDKSLDREKFEARIKDRVIPENIQKVITEEMGKLALLETQSSEYGICRSYIDWLTILPWGIYDKGEHGLDEARKILEEDHYGLEEIKERIIEFMAVSKLTGSMKGSIICLVGPPGVGKTSIGKSIARALNRKFFRFSVGGMRDEAEIKGHRRTYIGAMPGKLIQALKICQVMNPVIMLDEVDKMGVSYQGDPASALLEVLDPEQNNAFLDHYLDVRCDLSDVLFIVTANVLDTIPAALRDRMEILRLSGYIPQEKIEIAKRYLIPRNRKQMGLKVKEADFASDAVRAIINSYAREAGVRALENQIKKIIRKVAVKLVEAGKNIKVNNKKAKSTEGFRITAENLDSYLGKPIYTDDQIYNHPPVGVCVGLAWTAVGGVPLYIEAIKLVAEKTAMKLTGQVGNVMKESSEIAWSYLHSSMHKYAPQLTFFENAQVHIHIPEGATPKDGPSAGVTMVTALISLLIDTPIKSKLGMTGELTLTGKVLPVGGIKEKFVGAKLAGLKTIIMPKGNVRDYEELPEYVKKGIKVHFVENYEEVFEVAFKDRS